MPLTIEQLTWAKTDLPDPITYYGGYKEARLMSVGDISRALSDYRGEYEAATFNFVVSDHDNLMRDRLSGTTSKWIINKFIIVRMIDDAGRRALLVPRVVAIGYLRDYKLETNLKFSAYCEDYLALYTGLGSQEKQIPKRKLTQTDFPYLPLTSKDKPVPIVYGDVSDESSTASAPVLTGTYSLGAFTIDGFWQAGFGPLPCSATPPTSASASLAAGGTISSDVQNRTWYFQVTSVDGTGRESDPYPYYSDSNLGGTPQVTLDEGDNTKKAIVSWSGATGAVKYRCYMGGNYYGIRWVQYIEVDAPTTSCVFDSAPAAAYGDSTMATGAQSPPFAEFWYYVVTAVMSDGETGTSAVDFGIIRGYRRPIRIEWLPVVGALSYKVYRRSAASAYDLMWEVPATQTYMDDDLLRTNATVVDGVPAPIGSVPVTYVGQMADLLGNLWHAFLVAGHAVKQIISWYSEGARVPATSEGVDWMIPGYAGHTTYFGATPYKDINGRRYTLIYVRGAYGDDAVSGTRKITLNVRGVEDVGDGSGTVISDIFDQYKHAMRNWILGDYQSGNYPTTGPTWPNSGTPLIEVINDDSFDAAGLIAEARIAGGYIGAFIIGANEEFITVREQIKRFNLSSGSYSGFSRKSQYIVKMLDETIALTSTAHYTQLLHIYQGTFEVTDSIADFENNEIYSYKRNYQAGTWKYADLEITDAESVEFSGQEKLSQTSELWMVTSATQATDIITRRLRLLREPLRWVKFQTNLGALSTELGDVIRISHHDGVGAVGYEEHPIFVMKHTLNPDTMTVTIEGVDVDRIFKAQIRSIPEAFYVFEGHAPSVNMSQRSIATGKGTMTLTGYAPVVV